MKKVVIITSILLSFVLLFTISQSVASATTIGAEKKDKPTEQTLEKTEETPEATLEAKDNDDKLSKEDKRATQEAKKATQQQVKEDRKATHKPDKPDGKNINLKGIIEALSSETITLITKDGSTVVIAISAETTVKIPSMKNASLSDLQVGLQAAVHAIQNEENLLALSISVIPAKPTKLHRVGIVTEYSAGNSITIRGKDGGTSTYMIDPEVKILPVERAETLGVGSKVTIISPRDPGSTTPIAKGIVIHPQKSDEETDSDD